MRPLSSFQIPTQDSTSRTVRIPTNAISTSLLLSVKNPGRLLILRIKEHKHMLRRPLATVQCLGNMLAET
jgi:hypothetical protein